jgi:dipeptidyl aminopeptidase/acylaminoacyl peptidase
VRFLRAVAVLVVVLVAFVFGFAKLTSDNGPHIANPRLGKGLTALDIGTSTKVRLSPDGSRIAVVEDGGVTVVGLHDAKIVTRAGTNVVDATWMPDGKRVLVVEGPIPTGQIATIDMTGHLNGVATLNPSIGFGNGDGIAVDERGTKAAVIAVTRDAIGGAAHTDLAVIELQTGKVRVYPTPRNEAQPMFVADDLVALASQGATGPARLDLVELASGSVDPGRPIIDGPYVRTFGEEVVVARRAAQGAYRLVAVNADNGHERTLHVTKPHRHVVAVNAQVTLCLVRVVDPGGTAHLDTEGF